MSAKSPTSLHDVTSQDPFVKQDSPLCDISVFVVLDVSM